MREGSRRTGFRPNRARSQRADGEYAAEQPQGLPAVIAELTRWAAQNLELTLKSEINVGPRLSEEGRLKRRSRKCNTTRGEPKACAKEEANQSEWRQGGEWSGLLFSIRKGRLSNAKEKEVVPSSLVTRRRICRKRGSGEGRTTVFTLAHEVAGLARSANRASEAGKRTAAQRLGLVSEDFERELPLMQRQGPATLEGPPTTRITVANPPLTLLNG
ncbi:hypothetical protein L1887_63547 [Cichorium endivia]|nr:hypothetical protein L1887_63547 [Cichorium endivia]